MLWCVDTPFAWSRPLNEPDAAARLALERELAQRERDYAALVDSALDVFARYDRDKRILYVNKAGERHAGMPAASLVGKTFREAGFPEEIIPIWDAALDRVLRTGVPHRVEFSLRHGLDGTLHHYETVLTPESAGGGGGVEGVVALTRDVTERRNAEAAQRAAMEAARAAEERYRALVDAASQIVWTNTAEGEMRGPQPGWCAFTGQSEAQVQGFGWAQAVHPEDAGPTIDAWNEAVRARAVFLFEHRVRRHDGAWRTCAIRAVPVLEGDGRTIREWVGIHTDVTEQRQRDQWLREAAERQRRFLREMLAGVTEGRLRLCDTESDLPAPLPPACDPVELSKPTLRLLRAQVGGVAEAMPLAEERRHDLILAVGEAGMNAVVHAGGGRGRVHADCASGTVQVWIRDQGTGIQEESLHRATLEKGFSTGGSLGHGFFLMLQTADAVWLLTGPAGTTVVLEQHRTPPQPTWLQRGAPK